MDFQIGRVLEALKESGEYENTYIFFTSDHGIAIGKHGLMGKQNLYEHSWKIPFVVSGPEIKKNTEAKGNIYLLDVLPTLCEIAGITIPETVDGISFNKVLTGKKSKVRNVLYGAYSGGFKPGMRSIKKGNWKLIKYDVMDGAFTMPRKVQVNQLFNLNKNPNELLIEHQNEGVIAITKNMPKKNQINLAENPKYKSRLQKMEKLLFSEMEKVGDPFKFWNQK